MIQFKGKKLTNNKFERPRLSKLVYAISKCYKIGNITRRRYPDSPRARKNTGKSGWDSEGCPPEREVMVYKD
jgi:hypothetical protein